MDSVRELRDDDYPEPLPRAWDKEIGRLDEHCANFLRCSRLAMLATSDTRGRTTVTPRGGPPGFARVLDDQRIAWADLSGNGRIDAFRQILDDSYVGLLCCHTRDAGDIANRRNCMSHQAPAGGWRCGMVVA